MQRREIKIGDLVKVKRSAFDKTSIDYYPGKVVWVFTLQRFGPEIRECEVEYRVNGELRRATFDLDQLDFDLGPMRERLLKELGIE